MEIRLAVPEDVSEIVSVLRKSLGEAKLPKSEEIWNFKHAKNPFGRSLVLVAVADEKIVGIRSFMRWKWQYDKHQFSCLRAVDTATLPDYQGRGIFKKLTLKAVEIATEEGDHLVFSTPNSQSMPGYLKMGWEKVDKLSIKIVPCNPLNWRINKEFIYNLTDKASASQIQELTQRYNQLRMETGEMFTPKSFEYLNWRYYDNPLQDYQIMTEENFFLSGYVKVHKYFRELRITEAIFVEKNSEKKILEQIRKWAKNFGVQVISIADSPQWRSTLLGRYGKFGPVLTLRNLNLESTLHEELLQIENWGYSLGDLELF